MKNRIGTVISPGKVQFIEKEIATLLGKQLLIAIKASSICGSDLHYFYGRHPVLTLPIAIGHEFSGDVIEVGQDVDKFKPGDRVVVEPLITCGKCDACKRGDYTYCENLKFTFVAGKGAMAPFFVAEEQWTHKLDDELTYAAGSLIEPFAVAVCAARRARVSLGDKIVIFGAGIIGLALVAACKRMGARDILAVDLSDYRLGVAIELGATKTINAKETDVLEYISKYTKNKGLDKSFECVGVRNTFVQALNCLRKNGVATVLGIFEEPNIEFNVSRIVSHQLKVLGSQGYCRDFEAAQQICKEINVEKLITHRFPLRQLQEAMETALNRQGKVVKVCLFPEENNQLI